MAQLEKCLNLKDHLNHWKKPLMRFHQLPCKYMHHDLSGMGHFLMETIQEQVSPTFFRYVTHRTFIDFVKEKRTIIGPEAQQANAITNDEEDLATFAEACI